MAPGRVQDLLAMEVARSGRTTADRAGTARTHPTDEQGEPLWGAPRIHGELLKLGFEVAESTVSKYMIRRRGPPSQTWGTFLRNHADAIAAIDLCVVPTLTFESLFAFLVVGHGRRQLLWFAILSQWHFQRSVRRRFFGGWGTTSRLAVSFAMASYRSTISIRVRLISGSATQGDRMWLAARFRDADASLI